MLSDINRFVVEMLQGGPHVFAAFQLAAVS